MLQAAVDGVEAVVGPGRAAHELDQLLPFVIGQAGDDGPVVVAAGVGAVGVVGRGDGAAVVVDHLGAGPHGAVAGREPLAAGLASVDGLVQERGAGEGDAGNHLGQVNVLPFAGGGAMAQRRERADCAVHPAGVVQVGPAPSGRGRAGQTRQMGQAAEGLGRRTHSAVPVVASGVAEASHGDVDDVGADFPELFVAEAPALHDAAAEVLDDDVGPR